MASNGKLPKGWQYRPLRDLIESDRAGAWGDAPKGKGDVYVVRSTNLNPDATLDLADVAIRHFPTAKLDKLQLKQGDILLERSGGGPDQPVGRIASFEADGTYVCSNFMQRLRAKSTRCRAGYLKYLLWYFHHCGRTLRLQQRTSGIRNLAYEEYLSSMWPVPPVEQQESITDILSSVDEAIEATRAVIDQTRRLKTALLQDLLTKGLGHSDFKKTKQGKIPATWTLKTVGELCEFSSGHGFSHGDWSTKGLPIIRIQNLNGSNDFNYYAGEPDPRWIVDPGELLFAWAGVKGVSFGPCLWPGPVGLLNQHIYRIRPNCGVDKGWLYAILGEVTHRIEAKAHGFKTSLVHVHKSDITDQVIATPPPEEQVLIANRVSDLDNAGRMQEEHLAQLSRMKSAMSQGLLTGRIPVKGEK